MSELPALPARNSPAWRWWLALALILPIPLLWGTGWAYATRDFYNVPGWFGSLLVFTQPAMTLVGIAILPVGRVTRISLMLVLIPVAIVIEFGWGVMFVCSQFGDCP